MTVYVQDSTCAIPENWGDRTISEALAYFVVQVAEKGHSIEPYIRRSENGVLQYVLNIRDSGDGGLIETLIVYEE